MRLQREYEEAIRQVRDRRADFLRTLYLYAIVNGRQQWKGLFGVLLDAAEAYGESAGRALRCYRTTFLGPPRRQGDPRRQEALFAAIKQLGCYYENSVELNTRLLLSYVDEIETAAGRLDAEARACLLLFVRWLRDEADGRRVPLMTVWDRGI